MTEPIFRSNMTVELIRAMAGDDIVVQTAKVSTLAGKAIEADVSPGFIGFLVKNRHGSPFEHSVFTWYIEAPIFVWREFMRHRLASYNEESGRYKQLNPVFYVPADDRNMQQVGKPGHYDFVPGTEEQRDAVSALHMEADIHAYDNYQALLDLGVAKEVARMSLPVNIYSSAFVTMNARALTNFLSLRTKDEDSTFPSFPQREIEMVAEKMEDAFRVLMPITYNSWASNGRVPL